MTFAVWVLGADRPGIVAAVTGGLYDAGGNLRDVSMTVLSGQLAMVLVVDAPEEADAAGIEAALDAAAGRFDLVVAVRPIELRPGLDGAVPGHIVSVYGADRPGIVHRVSSVLAAHDVNITDLESRVIGEPDHPVYALLLEVAVPEAVDPDQLTEELAALAADLGVDATLHPSDADIL